MGSTKTDFYTQKQNTISTLSKAIAHPARIAIIEFLLKNLDCICNDIVNELPLAQPTVSQHLKELKNAGIIIANNKGNTITYNINEDAIIELHDYFFVLSSKLERLKRVKK